MYGDYVINRILAEEYLLKRWIFFFMLIPICSSQDWKPPYFLDPQTEGVTFKDVSQSYQVISMEEELSRPILLAIINYDGDKKPEVKDFSIGSSLMLDATVEKNEGDWIIQVNKRQDYENTAQQKYQFSVYVGDDKHDIFISLLNIFDEAPTVTYNGPCRADELSANFNTKCIFRVYDRDGLKDNKIRLEIEGNNSEDELFDFRDRNVIGAYEEEWTLYVKRELHYEQRQLYNFKTVCYDIENNSGSIITIVEVIDLPNMDPIWVKPFATASFPEKSPQTFHVEAADGDTGINKKIWYKLEFPREYPEYKEFFRIDKETGELHVNPIDRDARNQDTYTFDICAYKYDNESWTIKSSAVIIIQDINDHYPEITMKPDSISFKEETYLTIPFDKFEINDMDLGDHATYNVLLSQADTGEILYSQAFEVIPNSGYQKSNFRLTVIDSHLLDYENEPWQIFELKIIAQEVNYPEHFREQKLYIELINWNDEHPIFERDDYSVNIKETIGYREIMAVVLAKDRDINDRVIHEIVGSLPNIGIDASDGRIMTTGIDALDYERQTTVMIQVKATDTLKTYQDEKLNTAYAQLVINVIDVNDETPDIRMPRIAPNITENSNGNRIVTEEIVATDPDTTADLKFEILWDKSYATKSGQAAAEDTYKNCFIIEEQPETINRIYGRLKVNPNFGRFIDYEMYEVIYLTIKVTDRNQEIRSDSAEGTLTIRIDDVNDNAPYFVGDTLITERNILEEADKGTLVGTILAIDIDGPGNNEFTYTIIPISDTPKNSIYIDPDKGVLTATENKIDCDDPVIHFLTYSIILDDGVNKNDTESIKIKVNDINNKSPVIQTPESVKIYENATTGEFIAKIQAADKDRDEPHNMLEYTINFRQFPDLEKYFEIEAMSGDLKVRLRGNNVLDRDIPGQEKHEIHITVEDNYQGNGRKNLVQTTLTLILLDVNDNAPEMPNQQTYNPQFNENMEPIADNDRKLIAPDRDDKNTPNGMVSYKILSIEPKENHADPIPNSKGLFTIAGDDKVFGILDVAESRDLKGFYGTWNIRIEAYDHGDEWDSRITLRSNATYSVVVNPWNFNKPQIQFPRKESIYRLGYADQIIGKPLTMTDGTNFPYLEANDDDGLDFGDIRFEIASFNSSGDSDFFEIVKDTRNKSHLILKKDISARYFFLNFKAVDGGFKFDEVTQVGLVFVDLKGEPVFDSKEFTTDFTENDFGFEEERWIPEARDPKNEGIHDPNDRFSIYYFIDPTLNENDAKLFTLNKETRQIRITEELDREEIDTHWLRIIATNQRDKPSANPNENSILIVKIAVNDVNDNPPTFSSKNYAAGITTSDYAGKPILTVNATDPDLDDIITFTMETTETVATGENIESIKMTMFSLDSQTGVITLNVQPKSNMKGYFEFPIVAHDLVDHTDEASVKIYIVAEANRVSFVFLNDRKTIIDNIDTIKSMLGSLYESDRCNIDDVSEGNGKQEQTSSDVIMTTVRVHFIKNNEPIEATEIQSRSNDLNFIAKLKRALLENSLLLDDVPADSAEEQIENMELMLTTVLIVVSVVLGTLCMVLLVAFFVRTRNLNKQLKAFTATDFGSTPSNLNRRGAPTTNVFCVEGSNPVLNNKKFSKDAFDSSSDDSDESDFIGINEDPNFITEERKESVNSVVISEYENNIRNSWLTRDRNLVEKYEEKDEELSRF